MVEQKLIGETIKLFDKYYSDLQPDELANQIFILYKKALPELAKEAGYFREEAEWIESLLKKGWIPPAEARHKDENIELIRDSFNRGYEKGERDEQTQG